MKRLLTLWGARGLFVLIWGLILYVSVWFKVPSRVVPDEGCLRSFTDFAYYGPSPDPAMLERIAPAAPWQVEAVIPHRVLQGYADDYRWSQVALVRTMNSRLEVWTTNPFAIYYPDNEEWEFIDREIDDTGLFVGAPYVISDGRVWGGVRWDLRVGQVEPSVVQDVPSLSQFDERTRQFELAEGAPEIPRISSDSIDWPEIIVDRAGNFWLFVENDGIYRYDPVSQTSEWRAALPESDGRYAALAPDGSIYFTVYKSNDLLRQQVPEDGLFQFSPNTNAAMAVDAPEGWPLGPGLFIDHLGQVWLGTAGYQDVDQNWNLTHPAPWWTFDHLGMYLYAMPRLNNETSDGRLWFDKYLDSSGKAEGTAWYDPQSGDGCMFTNYPALVVEDAHQRLWMAADGVLYSANLNER